eukprot:TRINITY_DN1152_c0_g2_i3.p1 TRINITY_DN1152_c0_g2~~TRINITY_DN1152_c0_g2_i3.p1  ORF type:complete len:190 (-),score=24.65 TRINITY_DN1152_c0_g2_i3:269-838(-)
MDIWGTGCVFFEILSLFPLFPGNDEVDQVHKIHNILGTPPRQVLDDFKRHATHMQFNFPPKEGTGISKLIPHASIEAQDFISKSLAYTPDSRITAKQALSHPYFRDLRSQEKNSLSIPESVGIPDDRSEEESSTHYADDRVSAEYEAISAGEQQELGDEAVCGEEEQFDRVGCVGSDECKLRCKSSYRQ